MQLSSKRSLRFIGLQSEKREGYSLFWIAIGKDDFLYEENVKYRQFLDEKGFGYEYFENGEGHIWRNWRIYLTMFVPRLFK